MKKAYKHKMKLTAISLAVASMFMANMAFADEDEIKDLTQPKSSVQVEAINVDNSSAKFGEYNGLNRAGAYVNGNINIRGGNAYADNENGGTQRWAITGDNLGLTSRSAGANISDQGSWNIGINFDQLQHNTSNSYQTPYQGTMGGNTWTLPSNFGTVRQGTTNTAGTGTQGMSAAQLSDFQGMNISNTRENTTLNGGFAIDRNTNINFEYNHLAQSGAKLSAFSSSGTASAGAVGQGVSILPNPTNSSTDTVNLGVNWVGENSHLNASYFGSFFQNNVTNVQWQTFYGATTNPTSVMQTMSQMPSNSLNQLNLAGGYDFTSKTKLTSNLSFGQNVQNQGFGGTYDSFQVGAGYPTQSSLNGLVNTSHADLKLSDQSIKDLTLTALAKLDERDNLTQSNMYGFYGVGGNTTSTTNDLGVVPNTPESFKQSQLALSGDYKLTKDQRINLAYSYNNTDRWCNQYGTPGSAVVNTSSLVFTPTTLNSFYNSPSCVSATSSKEDKVDATYKLRASEDVNIKLGAGFSDRNTNWNQNAIVAMPYSVASNPGYPGGTALNGYNGQPAGYNSGNYLGFYPFFEASRKEFSGKGNVNWQATDKLSLGLGGKYTNDTYPDSTYGVQNGYSWSLNFDSTYAYAENGTLVGYVTQQNMQRTMTNQSSGVVATATLPAYSSWTNSLQTNATTIGLNIKQGGLAEGRLTLVGDATYSLASSNYGTQLNYNPLGTASPCNGAANMTCGSLPRIQNNMAAIKVGGYYQVDKNSKIGLMYWYQHLYSNDYYYNGYQTGVTPIGVLPTNQTAPSYSINVLSASYTYTFD